ncbi:MAG: VCBS repeat-containing protein, partial [Hymenobacter sp.]
MKVGVWARAEQVSKANNVSASSHPFGLAVGDVNGDGKPDLLVAKANSDAVGVLLGAGNGTFQAIATYASGSSSYPRNLKVADVNGDGYPDLVTANSGSNSIGLLLGNGTGAFPSVSTYPTGTNSQPWDVAVADVNGDGRLDMLATNITTSQVAVLLNTGSGIQAAATYSTGNGTNPTGIAVRDVNADGKLDVLTANYALGSTTAILLLGNGNGTFQPAVALATGSSSSPIQLAVGDVNSDGKPDVLTANYNSSTASVLLGTGNGTFQPPVIYSTGSGSNAQVIALGDMNGDTRLDLVAANSNSNSVGVLLPLGWGAAW